MNIPAVFSFAALALLAPTLRSQCSLQLTPTIANTGADVVVNAIANLPNGDLVAAGLFTSFGGAVATNIAVRRGGIWLPLGTGIDGVVNCLAVMPNGDLVAGGRFTQAGGVAAANIARWDGTAWSSLGSGLTGIQVSWLFGVQAMLVRPNGHLVASGSFLNAGAVAVNNIAAWDGAAWSALGAGIPGASSIYGPPPLVQGLANLPNGELAATGGGLSVQRFSGGTWVAMNTGMVPSGWGSGPRQLFVRSNGDLFVGGNAPIYLSSQREPFVRRWNGSAWQPFGPLLHPATAGSHIVLAMADLPNGDLVVGGSGVSRVAGGANEVLRGDGSSWTPLPTTPLAMALSMQPDGRLLVGGYSGFGPPYALADALAEYTSTCPASVANVGSGCAGSLGVHTLTASSLPWLGSTFRAVTTAVPTSALALAVTSLSPTTVPLAAVFPFAGAGCDGLLSADLTELLVPTAGEVVSSVALPLVPALVALPVYHHVDVFEFSPVGTVIALTTTGRLELTLGLF